MARSTKVTKRRRWTEAEVRLLLECYSDSRTADIATVLERPLQYVYAKAMKLGLRKSKGYLASENACRLRRGGDVGKPYRFAKGHVPANKGSKRPGWSPGRMRQTQFPQGHKPQTWLPVGTEVCDSDGYLKRKLSDDRVPTRHNWKYVHVIVWEAAHGPVPAGHRIAFKDGNKKRIEIENLELITPAEAMRRNTYHRWPKDLAQLVQLRGVVVRQINRRVREARDNQEGEQQP